MNFDGLLAQSNQAMNPMASFSSAPPFNSGPCGTVFTKNLDQDPFFVSYAYENSRGGDLRHEYSVGGTGFSPEQMAEGRTAPAETGGPGPFIASYPHDISTVMADDMAEMGYFSSPTAIRTSPPFVIPSQMLNNVDHPCDPVTGPPSLTESPEVSQDGVLDSYYHSDGTVVAVAYRPSDIDMAPTKRKGSLPGGSQPSSRKRSAAAKFLDPGVGSSRFPVRALKPECTRATATRSKKYKCLLCSKGFDRQEHYKRHLISDTHRSMLEKADEKSPDPPPKKYKCPACNRSFNRHDNLKPHIKTHLMTEGKHRHNPSVTVEDSIRYGWEDMDPRIKPALLKADPRIKPALLKANL